MYSYENKSNMNWSAADMFAVCFSCAKNASEYSSVNRIFGTVLMAVPFFVFTAIICLININIIMGLLIALIIISIAVHCCCVSKLKGAVTNTSA
ncbi:MAG: hypothetical protein IJ460_02710 [Clostridia bacterium]|nr:hypothetical protein [Clostridia bacterium]